MTLWQRLLFALATGYVFFFYSERMFWSFLRPGDAILFQVIAWLLYSFFTYMTLAIIARFNVNTLWSLFLAGTAFGWIVEGIYAMTFFGNGGIVLPFSIVWTGIASHALLSVVIGWYYLYRSLAYRGYLHSLAFSSLLGLYWGVWAVAWALETPPILSSYDGFIGHALITTLLLMLALWLHPRLDPANFRPTKWEYIVLFTIALGYTLLVTLPTVQFMLIILIACFGVLYLLLERHRKTAPGKPYLLTTFSKPISIGKLLCLIPMPIIASLVYVAMNDVGLIIPSNMFVFIITSIAGTLFFLLAAYKIFRQPKGGEVVQEPPLIQHGAQPDRH